MSGCHGAGKDEPLFTGLIEDVGTIVRIERRSRENVFEFSTSLETETVRIGDSIACNGVCLTATSLSSGRFSALASHETLARSTFSEAKIGDRVNLERALKMGDRLGGHLVAGHVDARARLSEIRRTGEAMDLNYTFDDRSLMKYIIEKGSIAVDGVSLTVNRLLPQGFGVTLIPHTAQKTILTDKRVGQGSNIEVDLIGKYVESLLFQGSSGSGTSRELLEKYGFSKPGKY